MCSALAVATRIPVLLINLCPKVQTVGGKGRGLFNRVVYSISEHCPLPLAFRMSTMATVCEDGRARSYEYPTLLHTAAKIS
jgi:hypothetical protein